MFGALYEMRTGRPAPQMADLVAEPATESPKKDDRAGENDGDGFLMSQPPSG